MDLKVTWLQDSKGVIVEPEDGSVIPQAEIERVTVTLRPGHVAVADLVRFAEDGSLRHSEHRIGLEVVESGKPAAPPKPIKRPEVAVAPPPTETAIAAPAPEKLKE